MINAVIGASITGAIVPMTHNCQITAPYITIRLANIIPILRSIFCRGIENYEAELIGVVVYRDCYFTLDRKKENGHIPWVDWPIEYFQDCEVVGNIFENPSLLEAK